MAETTQQQKDQLLTAIRKEKTLNPIIKYESLVVNGLDKNISRDSVQKELERVFKTLDSGVKDIKVIANNSSGEPLGHAYINFITAEKAKKSLAKHKYTAKVNGKPIKMMFSVRPNEIIHSEEVKALFSICIKNLDPTVDLQKLDEHFAEYGQILRSHVDNDKFNQRYALIQYIDQSSSLEAVKKGERRIFMKTVIQVEPYTRNQMLEHGAEGEDVIQDDSWQEVAAQQQQFLPDNSNLSAHQELNNIKSSPVPPYQNQYLSKQQGPPFHPTHNFQQHMHIHNPAASHSPGQHITHQQNSHGNTQNGRLSSSNANYKSTNSQPILANQQNSSSLLYRAKSGLQQTQVFQNHINNQYGDRWRYLAQHNTTEGPFNVAQNHQLHSMQEQNMNKRKMNLGFNGSQNGAAYNQTQSQQTNVQQQDTQNNLVSTRNSSSIIDSTSKAVNAAGGNNTSNSNRGNNSQTIEDVLSIGTNPSTHTNINTNMGMDSHTFGKDNAHNLLMEAGMNPESASLVYSILSPSNQNQIQETQSQLGEQQLFSTPYNAFSENYLSSSYNKNSQGFLQGNSQKLLSSNESANIQRLTNQFDSGEISKQDNNNINSENSQSQMQRNTSQSYKKALNKSTQQTQPPVFSQYQPQPVHIDQQSKSNQLGISASYSNSSHVSAWPGPKVEQCNDQIKSNFGSLNANYDQNTLPVSNSRILRNDYNHGSSNKQLLQQLGQDLDLNVGLGAFSEALGTSYSNQMVSNDNNQFYNESQTNLPYSRYYQLAEDQPNTQNNNLSHEYSGDLNEMWQTNLLCPISLQTLKEPVMADDGLIYEKNQIESWLLKNTTSPMTNQNMGKNLKPVEQLQVAIQIIQDFSKRYKDLQLKLTEIRRLTYINI